MRLAARAAQEVRALSDFAKSHIIIWKETAKSSQRFTYDTLKPCAFGWLWLHTIIIKMTKDCPMLHLPAFMRIIFAGLALTAFAPALANAQSFAVVNIQKIMGESSAAKSVKKQLESKQKSFQSEVKKKETELQKKERDLAGQRSVLSAEEFKKRVQSFGENATAAQRDVQKKRTKLDAAFAKSLTKIQDTVAKIAKGIAESKGYEIILPRSQLLYANPKHDITDQVLSQLNKELPNVSIAL